MLSFIVPAHDEEALLPATLAALHAAATGAGESYEVIVVDDASTDRTAAIAAACRARVVRIDARHIAAARNAGARAACGDHLVFVDADTRIDVKAVAAALRALRAGASGGGASVRLTGARRWHERLAVPLALTLLRLARIAPGCFLFCTRAAFDATGGFDERLFAGEDVAMSRSLARHGRFVLLREHVHTSDRKLRTHALGDHLRLLWRFLRRGRGLLRSRQGLELWYGERRSRP